MKIIGKICAYITVTLVAYVVLLGLGYAGYTLATTYPRVVISGILGVVLVIGTCHISNHWSR